jgi:hypothetical protein
MNYRTIAVAFLSVFVCLAPGCKSQLDPVGELFKEMVDEYGGVKNLEKLNSHSSVWDLKALMRGDAGTDTRYVMLPERLRVEFRYSRSTEFRILNGEEGYSSRNGSPAQSASGPRLDSMKLQLMRRYTPLTLLERKGDLSIGEGDSYKLLTLKDGTLTTRYFVNPQTSRVEKVTGQLEVKGRVMEFLTEYSDFRKVEGVLMPHKEVKYAGGFNTAVLTLKEVRLNEKFEERVFKVR